MPRPAPLASAVLALAAFVLPATASATEPNLVAKWSLDGVTGGSTPVVGQGVAYDGSVFSGSLGAGRPGFGSAISFGAGGGTGIDAGPYSDPGAPRPLETSSVSVLAWVKAAGAPGSKKILVLKSAATAGFSAPLKCDATGWALRTGTGGGPQFVVGTGDGTQSNHVSTATPELNPNTVWDGTWHALAGTFDAGTKKVSLALDGTVVSTATAPPASTLDWNLFHGTNDNELSIGRFPNADAGCSGHEYVGDIDEVRVYDRALEPGELTYLQEPAVADPRSLPAPGVPTPTPSPTPTAVPESTLPPSRMPGPVPSITINPSPTLIPPTGVTAPSLNPNVLQALSGSQLSAPDIAVLLAALQQQMTSSSRDAVIKNQIDKAQSDKAALLGQQQEALQRAADALKQGAQLQMGAGVTSGALSLASAVLQIQSLVGTSKVKTTSIAFPPAVAAVAGGKANALFSSPQVNSALQGIGKIVGINFGVQTATLPKTSFEDAQAKTLEQLTAQMQQNEQQMKDLLSSINSMVGQITQALNDNTKQIVANIHGISITTPIEPFSATATTQAKPTLAQLRARLKKARKKLRDTQKKHDAAAQSARSVAVSTFAQAGAVHAQSFVYKIKGCSKKTGCPFAFGG